MFRQILPLLLLLFFLAAPIDCRHPHVINFRWANLYPESFTWDPKSDHFVVGSLRQRLLISVSDAGVVSALISDDSLPANASFLGISLDPRLHRILAVVHSPPFSGLVAYQLPTFRRLFLTHSTAFSPPTRSRTTSRSITGATPTSPIQPMTSYSKSPRTARRRSYPDPRPSNPTQWTAACRITTAD
ncbi:UNVERIFIED_CONTAM: hypothetical protein Slati_1806800 [Sesamum latifolium]|uniref:Uncharacterized protein n=1 Tax=Sesamum latifolium TaxID=2727402 RepID=A0AAW2X0M3_9LAMI